MVDPLNVDTSLEQGGMPSGLPGVDSPSLGASLIGAPGNYGVAASMPTLPAVATPQDDKELPASDSASKLRAQIVSYAKQFTGVPYSWGGTGPSGFDCSGLTQYVARKFGVALPRVSYQQANYGKRVSIRGLSPGDLVAWDNSSRNNGADHIALYIGNGMIIEAPRPGKNVRIRRLGSNEGAWGVRLKYPGE